MRSIANNEAPAAETLYDQPEIDKTKVRITGPFTVEALPAPVVKPLDDIGDTEEDFSAKQTDWRDQLLATGILGRGGSRLTFSRVEPLSGTKFLQAEAETKEDTPRRAVICFAGETKPLDSRMVAMALDEAETLRPAPKLIIFAAFQFDPEAAKDIDEMNWPGVTILKAQMNTDLMTEDLKKKRSSDQSFWLVGQPDVELIHDGRSKRKFKVKVNGFDYYDVKKGTVESGSTSRIAMWMLDSVWIRREKQSFSFCAIPHKSQCFQASAAFITEAEILMKPARIRRYLISFVLILLRFSLIFKGFQRLVSWLLHHFTPFPHLALLDFIRLHHFAGIARSLLRCSAYISGYPWSCSLPPAGGKLSEFF